MFNIDCKRLYPTFITTSQTIKVKTKESILLVSIILTCINWPIIYLEKEKHSLLNSVSLNSIKAGLYSAVTHLTADTGVAS